MLEDYKGFSWGWIMEGGQRQEAGTTTTAMPANIVGVWGKVHREGIDDFHHEIFLTEYDEENPPPISMVERPLSVLLNLIRAQCIRLAYPEDGLIGNEILLLPEIEAPKFRKLQLWECKCGHTFYTELAPKRLFRQIIKSLVTCRVQRIACSSCNQIGAKKKRKVRKEIAQ